MTPQFSRISDITNSASINGEIFRKKSMLENFRANVLKEMAVVQKAFLNTTGPLCSLHDTLSSRKKVPAEGIKCIVEKTLCLLGSANHQLSVLRRKKVLANINKEKISLADQPLPNAKRFLFGEDFPSVVSKQAERSHGLGKNLSNAQKPKQSFQKSGITKDRQRAETTGNFSKYQINRPKKTIGPFAPTRAPQTKTQQLLREVERNNFRPRNLTCCVGMSNPFPLCTCSVTCSSSKMFRFNSSPCRCRSEQTPVNRQYPFQKKISTADCSSSQKRRKLTVQ